MIEVNKRIYDFIRDGVIHDIDSEKTIETLKYGKFIVENAIDEIGVIKKLKNDVVQSVPVIGLQIVPTLGCNFGCIYCYQSGREKEKVIMSKEVMDAIIEYTRQKIEPTTQFLNVLWFGGEPLLAIDQIKYLSQSFIEITASKKMKYFSGIITNGYLLHESNIDILLKSKINYCQVTIDGLEDIHDKRRMLKGGGKTWRTIMENIQAAVSKGMTINVRINIDQTNVDTITDLSKELEKRQILDKIALTIGKVTIYGDTCKSIEDTILTTSETEKVLNQEDIKKMMEKTAYEVTRIVPDFVGCVASARHSFIVGPKGELYKCTKTVGIETERWGDIFSPDFEHPHFTRWVTVDNLGVEKCRKCSMVPLCQGSGCAFQVLVEKRDIAACEQGKIHTNYLDRLKTLYFKKQVNPDKDKLNEGGPHGRN